MTRTLTTATAARLAGTTVRTVRAWCQRQQVAAVKVGRRWMVELSSLLHRLNAARPHLTDWLRTGERPAVRTGRTLRRHEARHAARTEAHHRRTRPESPRRQARPAGHVQRALCTASVGTTAVEFLVGIGFPEAERFASPFGRAVAKAYRKAHGKDPSQSCIVVVNGRMHRVFGYSDIADLYAGAYSYQRTREFLTSQRTSALRELTAA